MAPSAPAGESFKGMGVPDETFDGVALRVLIVHARWNTPVIASLVQGAVDTMLAAGVLRDNIVIETVPGSYELPMACARSVTR